MLPLKGREQYTARCVKAASQAGTVIVADGSKEPQFPPFYDRPGIDYFYTGYDATYAHWFFKMVMALDRVETPYAMVLDNDDLVVGSGTGRCIEFLDEHPDYIACSGRVQGFWCWPDPVVGPHHARTRQYAPYDVPADYGQPTANARVLAGFQNSWSFYAVYRTEALRTIWREVQENDFSDLQVNEKFCAMRALTLGKAMCHSGFTSLLRQYGTGATSATSQLDFHHKLLTSNFSKDRDLVLTRMEHCGVDVEQLRHKWGEWYKTFLHRNYGPWIYFRRAAKKRLPWLADKVQNRHRYPLLRWGYR